MFRGFGIFTWGVAVVAAAVISPLWLAAESAESSSAPASVRNEAKPGQTGRDDGQSPSNFWSFKPIVKPAVPAVAKADWVRNPIDAFILAKMQTAGRTPAPEADRPTLIRRVTYDLLGLPPTPEEIRAFVADTSADAYPKLIDRLLASPHYGERWGRHWLDVARYAPGRIAFNGIKNTAGDSHYRDYVVRAFNSDKPYDRFVTEQLAGDLLPPAADRQAYLDQIIAPAFLSIGAWFDMETDPNRLRLEMIDDMINTTTKAFLGLSVACARCHDHKFDPIPTQDYYALAGVFGSTRLVGDFSNYWRDGRVRQLRPLALPDEVAANDAVLTQIADLKAKRWALLLDRHATKMAAWKRDESKYRAAAAKIGAPFAATFEAENFDGQSNLRIAQLRRGDKGTDVIETLNPTLQWVLYRIEAPLTATYRIEALYSTDDANELAVTVNSEKVASPGFAVPTGGVDPLYQRWDAVSTCELRAGTNFLRITAKNGNFPRLDRFRLVKSDDAVEKEIAEVAAEQKLEPRLLERFVYWPQEPWPTEADIERFVPAADVARLKELSDSAAALEATVKPYRLAIAVTDSAAPADLPIHIRGQTDRVSKELVPRGVPRLLEAALPQPQVLPGESGRLQLAQWLTDSRNPLTARVMVNRMWGWHFGNGIVESTSDFGVRGSPPSHPELLDWLASRFIESGWSVKQMQRLIMTSSTYRQGSAGARAGTPGTQTSPSASSSIELNQENKKENQNEVRAGTPGTQTSPSASTSIELNQENKKENQNEVRAGTPGTQTSPSASTSIELNQENKKENQNKVRAGTPALQDPDNRLLSHFPRQRLEAEELYDAMLSTTNNLPRQASGEALQFAKSSNRALYTLTTGRAPKGLGLEVRKMMTLFDVEMGGQPIGQRPASATPAQSLFWLNSPLVKSFAEGFATRLLKMDKLTDAQRIDMAYQLAVAHPPTAAMTERSLAFIRQCQEDGDSEQAAWAKFCQALYGSVEFRYVE